MNHRAIATALFEQPLRPFSVELWDGTVLPDASGASAARLVVRSARGIESLVPPVDEESVVQAFACGDLDIAGDAVRVIEGAARWGGPTARAASLPLLVRARVSTALLQLRGLVRPPDGKVHSQRRDARSVQHHYDVSDDFFRLFLDAGMTYSCAYFPSGRESLAEAQSAKLDLIEQKLGLVPGDRLLDVGCGWGSLIVHAVQSRKVVATGVTVSENQFQEARRRATAVGGIEVYRRDYRDLPPGPFDKVASIGMMEHVGRRNLDRYFAEIYRRMAPGGLLLNHAIADIAAEARTIGWMTRKAGGFIQRHIFPDSDLSPLGLVVQAAERQGFEVRDVESLREHYARTLCCWLGNLEERAAEAERLVGRETFRKWRLYLGASAAAFRVGKISVYQVLLAKRTEGGEAVGIPRCRGAWYEPPGGPTARTPGEGAAGPP